MSLSPHNIVVAYMMADMEVDMVVDMEVDKVAAMAADEGGHGG